MPGDGERPAPVQGAQRGRHQGADRGEQDRGVQRHRRRIEGVLRRRGTQRAGQLPGRLTPGEHVHLGALGHGDLGREMRGAAEPPYSQRPARRHLGPAQRPVADDPGAQQRGQLGVAEAVGQRMGEGLRGHHVLGVPAVEVPAGVDRRRAEVLLAPAAEHARPVGAAQPGCPDPVTGREPAGARASRHDLGDHLVAGRGVRPFGRQVPLGEVQIGSAYTATADPEQQLAGTRLGNRALDEAQRAGSDRPGLMHYPCTHSPTIRATVRARRGRADRITNA